MAATWRRRKGQYDTWHHCSNCSNWPSSNYDERSTKPTDGEQCNQCMSKESGGNCS